MKTSSSRPLKATSNQSLVEHLVAHGADSTAATELIQRVSKSDGSQTLIDAAAAKSFSDLIVRMGGRLVPVN